MQFSTLLADLRRPLNTIPHLRSFLQVSHDPNPRKKMPAKQYWRFPRRRKNAPVGQRLSNFSTDKTPKECKDRSSTSFSPLFELSLRQHRSSAVPRRLSLFFFVAMALLRHQTWWLYHGSRHASLDPARFFFCLTVLAAVVDVRRTVDLFSQFGHIVGDGNHRST